MTHAPQNKIPDLRFPEFDGECSESKFRELFEKVSDSVDVDENELYRQIGIRSHGKGIFHKSAVSGKSLGNKRVFWIKEDAFVLNIVFAWEQAVAKTTFLEAGMIASHRFPMFKAKDGLADLDYFLRFFLTTRGKFLLELASPGGAGRNKTLGQKAFEELSILHPAIDEQKKIATFLSAVDGRIEGLEKKRDLLKEYKKGLMQKLFNQTLRFTDTNGQPFLNWEENKFSMIAERAKEKLDPTTGENSPCVELESLSQETGLLIKTLDSTNLKSLKTRFVSGDVLFGKLRPYLKKFLLTSFDGVCSSEIWVLRGIAVSNDFLYFLIQTQKFSDEVNSTTGSKMPRAEWKYIASVQFEVPGFAEQKKIADCLSVLDRKIGQVEIQVVQTREFKQGLLQQMFV